MCRLQPDWKEVVAIKPFVSSADLTEKKETLEILADEVHGLSAEGDPNVGPIASEDFACALRRAQRR